jgi:hypothetical protein
MRFIEHTSRCEFEGQRMFRLSLRRLVNDIIKRYRSCQVSTDQPSNIALRTCATTCRLQFWGRRCCGAVSPSDKQPPCRTGLCEAYNQGQALRCDLADGFGTAIGKSTRLMNRYVDESLGSIVL